MGLRRKLLPCAAFAAAGILAAGHPLVAQEIEILSVSPEPPATLVGVAPWPPGDPPPPLTSRNSVTVVTRFQSDVEAARIESYASAISPSGGVFVRVALPEAGGPVALCEPITGPSKGVCATAFYVLCEEDAPATITISEVGASLGTAGGTILARDVLPATYTVRCAGAPPPPRTSQNDCLVLGVPGFPKAKALPFGSELPICRCLQDQGAREFRCALLHPDFFMVRRVPIPLVAGQGFAETWEFLALTRLDGPVTMSIGGGGLSTPAQHVFGVANQLEPGAVERFVIQGVVPADPASPAGVATIEYRMKEAGDLPAFQMERTLPGAGGAQNP